jgi:hypothetical protein
MRVDRPVNVDERWAVRALLLVGTLASAFYLVIVPATGPFEDTYPAIYKSGIALSPVVPEITFRVLAASPSGATRVCGPRRR